MANYGKMLWLESWWSTILRIKDPIIRDDRTRRVMEYGFHHIKNLDGLDGDALAFMEEIFAKMDDMKENFESKTGKAQKYDYIGKGVWEKYQQGMKMNKIAEETDIPYDSVRKWIRDRKKEGYTGKSFPVGESELSENRKVPEINFPILDDEVPEKENSGKMSALSESGNSDFPVDRNLKPENFYGF